MPRLKRANKQERFDLYPDDSPDEKELSLYLHRLSQAGQLRKWIVRSLIDAMQRDKEQRR